MGKMKKIISVLAVFFICITGIFIYEVRKEEHYVPHTGEIVFDDQKFPATALVLKEQGTENFNLADCLTFLSDVDNGTANLETTKKVFGFYECNVNRVFDDYVPVISYQSSDENIAKIDENGIITPISKGTAKITVTADDVSLDIPITVYKLVKLTDVEQNILIFKGKIKSIFSLSDYEIPMSEIYSSNENIVAVNQDGTITGVSRGKAEVFVYTNEEKTEKLSTTVTVKQPVETVSIKNITIYMGDTATLNAAYGPTDADYGTSFTYKSADPSVAFVNGNSISGIKAGETTITAVSGNNVSGQAKVTVLAPPRATPTVTTIKKEEFDAYEGEKYTDGSDYDSYFKISFDHPIASFKLNNISDNGSTKTTGSAIYNNVSVEAGSPIYFRVYVNQSDVFDYIGFSYVNKDGTSRAYSLHTSGRDGSVLMTEY